MPYDPRVAKEIQSLLASGVSLPNAYLLAGVSQADRVYYDLNPDGTVIAAVALPVNTPEEVVDPFDGHGPAFDDSGNLQPGWELVDGEPVWVGFDLPTEEPEPQYDPFDGHGPAFDDRGNLQPGWELVDGEPVWVGFDPPTKEPKPQLGPNLNPDLADPTADVGMKFSEEDIARTLAAREQSIKQAAQQQATIQQRRNQTTEADWRVRLRLLSEANYLYKAQSPGILKPLKDSDGVIFPYTPTLNTSYQAMYDRKDLTHSNYRGFFYRNSVVNDIQITGIFTAQDTIEANYLIAVIHFFRSATKMFYGQDPQRGAPPPLVELSGYGMDQFNNHPCVISQFQYNLPNGVDYIRVTGNNEGFDFGGSTSRVSSNPTSTIETALNRLGSLYNLATQQKIPKGATPADMEDADMGAGIRTLRGQLAGTVQTTYVPTKMEITITLLPIQTRSQVSQQFSLAKFAKGDLLRGGFW